MKFRIKQSLDAGQFSMDWFNNLYGQIDYKDQTVLDIGADWGRTADLFLQLGAKRVISVEGKKAWYDLLEYNSKHIDGIIPIFIWLKTPSDISNLIKNYEPNIIKISTWPWSRCENWLLDISDNIITIADKYIFLSNHMNYQRESLLKLKKMFTRLNYDVTQKKHHVPYINSIKMQT
ncbi:MAG: hypothetical protein ABIH76_09065 [Candidatus Bathyarchaeota archaeon]